MDEPNLNTAEDDLSGSPETPEDVAVLYTWANVHGGRYRDFSASRREYRAQQRHAMVEAQRQAELEAARAKEEAAARELEDARRAEEEVAHDAARKTEAEEGRRRAEERAELERQAAQRHVETAEELKHAMEQAQREMEDARRRAEEQAARYAEADARLRQMQQGREVVEYLPGLMDDPYYFAGPLEPTAFAPGKGVRSSMPQRVSSESRITASYYRSREESGQYRAAQRRGESAGYRFEPRDGEDDARRASEFGSGFNLSPIPSRIVEQQAERMGYRPEFVAARTETREDTRERARNDERHRREALSPRVASYDDLDDDGYYDRAPRALQGRPPARSSGERGSAQSDLHIPPRGHRAPAYDHTERPAYGSDDLAMEETRAPEPVRRRRESATDFSARTERRPRVSEATRSAADPDVEALRSDDPQSASETQAARIALDSRPLAREGRPEWLLRDRPTEEASREQLQAEAREIARETQRRIEERERKGEEGFLTRRTSTDKLPPLRSEQETLTQRDTQVIRGTDGGFNLKPMLDRAPMDSLPPLRDRASIPDLPPSRERVAREEFRADAAPASKAEALRIPERPEAREVIERRSEARPSDTFIARRPQPEVSRMEAPMLPPKDESRRAARYVDPAANRTAELPAYREQSRPVVSAAAAAASQHAAGAAGDTLQQSRERVAARWFALKGLMNTGAETATDAPQAAARTREFATPTLAVVSLSGGVGKTSLVATVGRALSSQGEKVLLADTTAHGLLPYYFGARELRPDVVRTFSPPPGSSDAPVYMVNYETDRLAGDEAGQVTMVGEVVRHARGTQRVLLDLNGSSAWLARRMARANCTILVPIAPDMNSVLSIQNVDRFFSGDVDGDGRAVKPFYVLTQFDASLPLHLDVREVLRQQLGDRLLPVMIRRSPSVSEALAEGMTVMDYAPESPVTEDYKHLAEWVRNLAAVPANNGARNIRWSEQA